MDGHPAPRNGWVVGWLEGRTVGWPMVGWSSGWLELRRRAADPRPGSHQVWYGMVWYGMVWYGMVWYGRVQYGGWLLDTVGPSPGHLGTTPPVGSTMVRGAWCMVHDAHLGVRRMVHHDAGCKGNFTPLSFTPLHHVPHYESASHQVGSFSS